MKAKLNISNKKFICLRPHSVMLCGRFYMPAPWDNLSQSSQPRLPIPAVPPFCSPTHT